MWLVKSIFLDVLNISVTTSVTILILFAFRPLLKKLPAQARGLAWWPVFWAVFYPRLFHFRFGLQSFFVPRTRGREGSEGAEYFPQELVEGGTSRKILLPGGFSFQPNGTPEQAMQLTERVFFWLMIFWLVGMAVLAAVTLWRSLSLKSLREMNCVAKMSEKEAAELLAPYRSRARKNTTIWFCKGLPTSFVDGSAHICIQEELPERYRKIALTHEVCHLHCFHDYWKGFFFAACLVHWFNPLMWLAYRFFCRDIEIACDEETLRRIGTDRKEEYAEMLLALAAAKPLWGTPTAFGECDAAVRIRSLIHYRDRNKIFRWVSTGLVLVLGFLLAANPPPRGPREEIARTFEQTYWKYRYSNFSWSDEFAPQEVRGNAKAVWVKLPSETSTDAFLGYEGYDGSWTVYRLLYQPATQSWKTEEVDYGNGSYYYKVESWEKPKNLSEWKQLE